VRSSQVRSCWVSDRSVRGHAWSPRPRAHPGPPVHVDRVIDELDATRLGRLAQCGFLKIAALQMGVMLGDDPDPVTLELSNRIFREAPLRFLGSMSGGTGSIAAFEGLTTLLSELRITGRRNPKDPDDQ